MPITLCLDPSRSLVLETLSGLIRSEQLEQMLLRLYSYPSYKDCNLVLTDCRGALAGFNPEALGRLEELIREHAVHPRWIRNALVVDRPMETAYSMLFKRLVGKLSFYECEVFTTIESACAFLGIDSELVVKMQMGKIEPDVRRTLDQF
jgi:hypothetical protein